MFEWSDCDGILFVTLHLNRITDPFYVTANAMVKIIAIAQCERGLKTENPGNDVTLFSVSMKHVSVWSAFVTGLNYSPSRQQ